MKIRFEVDKKDDHTLFSEEEFYSKIDRSIEQAKAGYIKSISREELKNHFGL